MKILHKHESKLLNRIEVSALIDHVGNKTASNAEVKEKLVKELKADESLVVVKHINGVYGTSYSKIDAYQYGDKKTLDAIEGVKKEKKPQEVNTQNG